MRRTVSLLGEIEAPKWLSDAEDVLWLRVRHRFAPTLSQLSDAADFLDRSIAAQTGVLIFCGSGMGRAPTAYTAWRMLMAGSDVRTALSHIQRVRSFASPTMEQRKRLDEWHRLLSR